MKKIILDLPPMPHYDKIEQVHEIKGSKIHLNKDHSQLFKWLFIVHGRISINNRSEKWEAGEGHSILFPPNDPSIVVCQINTVFYQVQFTFEGGYTIQTRTDYSNSDWCDRVDSHQFLISQVETPIPFIRIEQHLKQMIHYEQIGNVTSYWRKQQQFVELLHFYERETTVHNALISVRRLAEQVENYLRENFQKEITNEILAEALHFHPNYISRCMKEIHRCTPMEYLLEYRIEQAKQFLLKTQWPVSAIAERVGFNYAPYFSTCFQRFTGTTPLAFRKQHL